MSFDPRLEGTGANGLAELATFVAAAAAIARCRQDLRAHEERAHHRGPEDEVGNSERGIVHTLRYRSPDDLL
jgi:predicted component of type VI protein secretion system